jgi:hypothetical protein
MSGCVDVQMRECADVQMRGFADCICAGVQMVLFANATLKIQTGFDHGSIQLFQSGLLPCV